MTRVIELIITAIATALAIIAGATLLLMMVQTVADVVMKNVAGQPIMGNLEIISVYHMVAVVFLPVAFVEIKHEHISVDLVAQLFPKSLRRVTETLGYLVCGIFFALLTYQTSIDAMRSYEINEIMMTSILITVWPAKASLPLAFAAVSLATFLHAWRAATDPSFEPVPDAPKFEPNKN